MKYITREAASLYLHCTKASFMSGLISWSQLMQRLAALRSMCSPSNPAGIYAERMLRLEEWEYNEDWPLESESPSNIRSPNDHRPSQFGSVLDYFPDDDDEDRFLCFFAGTNTGLSNWEFHQYDDDFFPSIPHGHWNGNKQPKLDPYEGWVYQKSKQIRREPRKSIISLWNDRQFRIFAKVAIEYYLNEHSHYQGWRVNDPLRLPRRR